MQEKLKKLLENSYSPYSHFPVSAVAVMKDGKEFYGVNVETGDKSLYVYDEISKSATTKKNATSNEYNLPLRFFIIFFICLFFIYFNS